MKAELQRRPTLAQQLAGLSPRPSDYEVVVGPPEEARMTPQLRLALCEHADLKPWARPGRAPYVIAGEEYEDQGILRQEWRCAECGIVVAASSRRAVNA